MGILLTGLLLLAGLAWMVRMWRYSRGQIRLEQVSPARRLVAQGVIIQARDDIHYNDNWRTSRSYHIQFSTQQGQTIVAKTSVTQPDVLGLKEGDVVTIQYLPEQPQHIYLGENQNENPYLARGLLVGAVGSLGCLVVSFGLMALLFVAIWLWLRYR